MGEEICGERGLTIQLLQDTVDGAGAAAAAHADVELVGVLSHCVGFGSGVWKEVERLEIQ